MNIEIHLIYNVLKLRTLYQFLYFNVKKKENDIEKWIEKYGGHIKQKEKLLPWWDLVYR